MLPWAVHLRQLVVGIGIVALLVIAWGITRGRVMAGASTNVAAFSPVQSTASSEHRPVLYKGAKLSSGRMIIQQASLTLNVKNPALVTSRIEGMVHREHGFVAQSSTTGGVKNPAESLTVRIPGTMVASFVRQVARWGQVTQQAASGLDVTHQYNDLRVQIQALQAEVQAYQRLYSRAQTLSNIIQIQQALSQAQAQVTNLKNQQLALSRSVQLATVQIGLRKAPLSEPGFSVGDTLSQSFQTMAFAARWSASVLLWILPWAMVGAFLGAPIWYIRRRRHQPS